MATTGHQEYAVEFPDGGEVRVRPVVYYALPPVPEPGVLLEIELVCSLCQRVLSPRAARMIGHWLIDVADAIGVDEE